MKITTLNPSPELSHVVDQYWYCRVDGLNSKAILVPMLNHNIIINYSDQMTVRWGKNKYLVNRKNNVILGIQTKPIAAIVRGRYEAIGILLKPSGLYEIFGLDASTHINRATNLFKVFGIEFDEIKMQIKKESDPVIKLEILDGFISSIARYYNIDSDLTSFYEELNNVDSTRLQIGKYIEKIDRSHSAFIQSFKNIYGTTPKQLILLHQINKSISSIAQTPEQPLVEIAMDTGFYDQAHFIKTFKRYTGILPNDFRKKVKSGEVLKSMPNFITAN